MNDVTDNANVVALPEVALRVDQASEWLAMLDKYEGNKTPMPQKEVQALQQWMAADADNKAVLFELAQLWDKMDALSRLSELFAAPKKSPKPVYGFAMAASFLLAGFIGLLMLNINNGDGSVNASNGLYQTAIGEHSTVTLSDGSELILNTNTRVMVSYTHAARLIHLTRGEVHVSVAKDPQRPLSVIAGKKYIQAIGTEFNIEITDRQNIELIVTEGKVRVGVHKAASDFSDKLEPLAANDITQPGVSPVAVSAGEALMLGSTEDKALTEQVTDVTAEDIEVKLSWRRGNLVFTGESLEDAVKEVGRYTSVEFVFIDEHLKKVRVGGVFKAGDVEGLLATLRENFNIVSQRIDGETILLGTQ